MKTQTSTLSGERKENKSGGCFTGFENKMLIPGGMDGNLMILELIKIKGLLILLSNWCKIQYFLNAKILAIAKKFWKVLAIAEKY